MYHKTVPTELANTLFRLRQRPTRTVYHIDVGHLSPDQAAAILKRWIKKLYASTN